MSTDPAPTGQTRRGFLDVLLWICGTITGLAAAIPAIIYLLPVTKKGPGAGRKQVEGAADLGLWESKTESVGGQAVILLKAGDEYRAYSAVCTHLGCIVHWDKQKKSFLCPCHAAAFDEEGKVIDGPPPAPLRPYKVSEAGGQVYIST